MSLEQILGLFLFVLMMVSVYLLASRQWTKFVQDHGERIPNVAYQLALERGRADLFVLEGGLCVHGSDSLPHTVLVRPGVTLEVPGAQRAEITRYALSHSEIEVWSAELSPASLKLRELSPEIRQKIVSKLGLS